MTTPTTISDDRLAQIVDGILPAFDWEVPIIAAELLARRAAAKQREEHLGKVRETMEANDPGNARTFFGAPKA